MGEPYCALDLANLFLGPSDILFAFYLLRLTIQVTCNMENRHHAFGDPVAHQDFSIQRAIATKESVFISFLLFQCAPI